jgi:hypothetical protein
MVDEVGRVAGKMYAMVSPAKWKNRPCLCTHSGSYGRIADGVECGTSITGFVDFKMRPLQEYVYEWALAEEKLIERKTYVMREAGTIRVTTQLIKDGETVETNVSTLGRPQQINLVTEASHIILLRLIMLEKRMYGGMDLQTLTFQGKVVKNRYVRREKVDMMHYFHALSGTYSKREMSSIYVLLLQKHLELLFITIQKIL